jgi:FAD/FMN-containing dehydrogenase
MGSVKTWQNGRDFLNFSNPSVTLEQCFGSDSAEALRAIRHEYDPDGLFVPPIAL